MNMIYEELQNCINNIYEKVQTTTDPNLKKILNKLSKAEITDAQKDEMLHDAISFTLTMGLAGHVDEKHFDFMFKDVIEEMVLAIPTLQTQLMFKVYLEDHPELWREINVPQSFNLAELCYVILSSFKAEGSHLFKIKYRNTDYFCDPYEGYANELFASNYPLAKFKFNTKSKLELSYDFGENYIFIIEYCGKEKLPYILNQDDISVSDGNGYGVIEDDHYMLDLYLDNPEKCEEYLNDMGLDQEEFYYDVNDFDTVENTQYVLEEFLDVKNAYENPYGTYDELEEDDEDDSYEDDDQLSFN